MERKRTSLVCSLSILGMFLLLLPSVGSGQVDCGDGGTGIQAAINSASPGDIITVTGTCNENIVFPVGKDNITLDGTGGGAIIARLGNIGTVEVMAKQVTIRGFTITGGSDAIQIFRTATAIIDNNIIENSAENGIIVVQDSFAIIINNTIQNNPTNGIWLADSSSAFIGIASRFDSTPRANTIQNNGTGIAVTRSSSARIVGNTVSNNTGDRIQVIKASQADISDNTVDGNGGNGIFVSQNSGVNLGNDKGTTIFDLPNMTTVNNGNKGLSCSIGGYADGRLGSLNGSGKHNATSFTKDCIDSLIY